MRAQRGAGAGRFEPEEGSIATSIKDVSPESQTQTLAAFGATCANHGATASGFHAHQKSVGASAASFRRLICTFHDDFSCSLMRRKL
jgi:hypothetical protein